MKIKFALVSFIKRPLISDNKYYSMTYINIFIMFTL